MRFTAAIIINEILHKNLTLLVFLIDRLSHQHAFVLIERPNQLNNRALRIPLCSLHLGLVTLVGLARSIL